MTIEQIKKHPYYPFQNFRTNDLSFLLLELYWAELFRKILTDQADGERYLKNWIPTSPADRNDANPIFHVTDRSSSPFRALRVIQRFNTDDLKELDLDRLTPIQFTGDAYVAFVPGLTYGATDSDGTTPIEELLISSDISEPCERLCSEFIKEWCVEQVSENEMQQKLDTYWKNIEGSLIEMP